MNPIDRETIRQIEQEQDVEVTLTGLTKGALVHRLDRMLRKSRRLILSNREFTHLQQPPEVRDGLVVDTVSCGASDTSGVPWLQVNLVDDGIARRRPVLIRVLGSAGADERARLRYADPDRRRNMTGVQIRGGRVGYRRRYDDRIVISAWNGDGVCTEWAISFGAPDNDQGSW